MIDSRKLAKGFIDYICNWVEQEYKIKNYDSFRENIPIFEEAYCLRDKGIEKRIQKQLLKRLNLKSTARYEINQEVYGMLYIKLLKDEYIPSIKMPKELRELEDKNND